MSVISKDISYSVTDAVYDLLGLRTSGTLGHKGFLYVRKDKITLSGTSGTATITVNGLAKTATFATSLTVTATNFVSTNAAAYLVAGVLLTASNGVLTFENTTKGANFTGTSTIVNATTNLTGTITANDTVIPVYKTVPESPGETYVTLGEIVNTEVGTKDDFVYQGSIPVIISDCSRVITPDKKQAQNVLNIVRGLLKPTKGSVPTGLIQFGHEGFTSYVEMDDASRPTIRLVDLYNFLIE